MPKCYMVLDQNYFRSDELKGLVDNRNLRFVVPDLAFLEMTKSDEWESTMRRSFLTLSSCSTRVYASISVGEALRREIDSHRSSADHMLLKPATLFLRDILQAVAEGTDGYAIKRIRANPDLHRERLAKDFLNHEQNKASATELIEATEEMISTELAKKLRARDIDHEDKLKFIFNVAPYLLRQTFERMEMSREATERFLASKPVTLRYIYVKAWFCLDWIAKGGFDGLKQERATNELLDHEYVLTASSFDGLYTKDRRVAEAYEALRSLLKRKRVRLGSGGRRQEQV